MEYAIRDILLGTVEGILQLEPSVLPVIRESSIIFNIVRSNKMNLKPRTILSYLVILDQLTQTFELDQKTFELLQVVILSVLSEDSVGKIR